MMRNRSDNIRLFAEIGRDALGSWSAPDGLRGGVLLDSTPRRQHATLINGAAVGAGQRGKTVVYDGSNHYAAATLAATIQHTDRTLFSAWINTTSTAAQQTIAATWNVGVSSGWQFIIQSSGSLAVFWFDAGASNYYGAMSVTAVPANTWLHVAALMTTGAASGIRLWIRGIESTTTTSIVGTGLPGTMNSTGLWIGRRQNGTGDTPFVGRIADFTIIRNGSVSMIPKLALRPGVQWETVERHRGQAAQYNRRRRLLVGAGS